MALDAPCPDRRAGPNHGRQGFFFHSVGRLSWKSRGGQLNDSASLTSPLHQREFQDRARKPPITVGVAARFLSKRHGGFMSKALAPKMMVPTEEERLEDVLHRRLGNRIRDLRVVLLPDGLILQGRTATYHAKQLAQHV